MASVLTAFADAGVAVYLAAPHRPLDTTRRYTRHTRCRLWADSLRYRGAEDQMLEILARSHGRRSPRGHTWDDQHH